MSKRKSKSEGFGMLSWLKKGKIEASEASEGDHNSNMTSSNTGSGQIQNAKSNSGVVTVSTVTSSDIAIKTFSNIITVPCRSERGSTLTSSSSVISSESDTHNGGNVINDMKKEKQ